MRRVVWAHCRCSCPPSEPLRTFRASVDLFTSLSIKKKRQRKLKKKLTWASYHCHCLLQTSPCLLIHQMYLYISISTDKHVEKKNYLPRAQTTQDALFGHFSHVRLCPNPCCCRCCRAVVVVVVVALLLPCSLSFSLSWLRSVLSA